MQFMLAGGRFAIVAAKTVARQFAVINMHCRPNGAVMTIRAHI